MVWPHVPQKLACGMTSWPQLPQNRRTTSVDIGVVNIGVILRPGFVCGLALLGRASEPLLIFIFGRGLLMTLVVGPRRRFGALLISPGGRFGALLISPSRRLGALLISPSRRLGALLIRSSRRP